MFECCVIKPTFFASLLVKQSQICGALDLLFFFAIFHIHRNEDLDKANLP